MKKSGPNDARGVVWAISKYFFILCLVLLKLTSLTITFRYLDGWVVLGKVAEMENGPNDTSGVVRAIGEFFIFFIFVCFVTN